MSHQTFNKKSYGFLLYILYSFFYAFPYTSVDTLVQAKQDIHEILMDMYAIRHTLDISQEPDILYTSTPYLDQ